MLFFTTQIVCAQNANTLIQAEKSFAHMAVDKSLRSAFLHNLDSSGLVFKEGKIINGLQQFSAAKESSIKLIWQPAYACMASSGDIGFTTGPYEIRKAMDSAVLAAGQYSSVWKKNAQGEWKLLVDLGIDFKTSLFGQSANTTSFPGALIADKKTTDLAMVETAFLRTYAEKGVAAFDAVVQEGSWFNLQGHHPYTSVASIQQALREIPAALVFKPVGIGWSSSHDMIYVYGDVEAGSKQENYLRVWVRTAKGWQILLQVIRR
ncbi:MAG TPA: hypothetical protein VMR70_03810 [Flavisolibacter sp.]|nr:hypothetical protein [Flavisolibacter sp.]